MVGKVLRTALQVGNGDGDVDFAGAFCLIEIDGAGQTVKTADVGAGVEVVDGETGVGVVFVHFVGGAEAVPMAAAASAAKMIFFMILVLCMRL